MVLVISKDSVGHYLCDNKVMTDLVHQFELNTKPTAIA